MQCSALKNHFQITTAGLSPVEDKSIHFIKLSGESKKALFTFHLKFSKFIRAPFSLLNKVQMKLSGNNAHYSIDDYKTLKKEKFDLIICHHPTTLEMAFKLKESYNSKIIFNAHEIYSFEFEDDPVWMKNNFEIVENILKKYLPKCDQLFSVNSEICDFYIKRYNCKCIPIHNSKPFYNLIASEVKTPIKIIHHGGAMPQRKLEQMADAVLELKDKFTLTFMLVNTNSKYLSLLKEKYEPLGIKFIETVPYDQIINAINKYDIGLYILPHGNINQQLALPNKLFEFIQAKLAVIFSPNTAMKNLILDNGIGLVSEGFDTESMVKVLQSVTAEQIYNFKKRAEEVSEKLSSEKDEKQILKTVNILLKSECAE